MDEEIKTQRKQWQKPELIVLVRSKPEEAILAGCKGGVQGGRAGGPNVQCAGSTCAVRSAS